VKRITPVRTGVALALIGLGATPGCVSQDGGEFVSLRSGEGSRTAALVPLVRIDGHTELLSPIGSGRSPENGVAVSEDRVFVLQWHESRIVVFDTVGRRRGTLGRYGEGPGELTHVTRLEVLPNGDLWARDSRLHREVRFLDAAASEFDMRTLPTTVHVPPTLELPLRAVGLAQFEYPIDASDYWAVLSMSVTQRARLPDSLRHARLVGRVAEDGTLRTIVTAVPARFAEEHSDGRYVSVPFSRQSDLDFAPDGSVVAWAAYTPTTSTTAEIEVRVVDATGVERFRTSFETNLLQVPRSVRRRLGRDRDVSPYYPVVDDVLVGTDSTVWVGHFSLGPTRSYTVLDADGELIGQVFTPFDERVVYAARHLLWVVSTDDLGVESIVKYDVDWSPTGQRGSTPHDSRR